MKAYPSIYKESKQIPSYIYAFDKLDGSNIRAEWSRKTKKFYKFGSRTQLIDQNTPLLGEAIGIFMEKYSEELSERFYNAKWQSAICFSEFYGINSFAGQHLIGEKKEVSLFDINGPRGLLLPRDYFKMTKDLNTCPLLYEGELTPEFIQQVKTGTLPGMSLEGVILKANQGSPGLPWMLKIKNEAWLEKLKVFCKGDELLFNKLA